MTLLPTLCRTRMIYLHTLGDSLIKVGEKDVRPTAPLVFAALLYLGIERGRRVPRAALQELLFPETDERSGAHSLRQLLYKLRQLGAPIEADVSTVSIRPEEVRDDTATELSLANGQLDRVSLGFLPDYAPRLSGVFDEWLDNRRAAVCASIRRQLVAAIGKSRATVNWDLVERLAHLVLDIDPLNEEATLALAEATALSGAKSEAIGMLARYEQETGRGDLRLPAAVLRRRISEATPEVSRRTARTPFLGREDDAEVVRHQIMLGRRGTPSLLVLAGEAGIGKTRLIEEVSALAALEGVIVLTVRCQSHYSSRPLSVFIELVPPLLSCRGALGVSPQSLAYLNLLTSHDDERGDRPIDERDDISRSSVLLAALRDLVDAVAAEAPLLIVIDDAHWADTDSVRELSGLVQRDLKRPLIVVYTTRLMESLQRVATIDDETIVRRLRPLDESSMASLAQRLLPESASDHDALVSWCVQTAAGNPFFLQMLCAHYAATGQPFTVPPDMISATTRRIDRLPQSSRRILEFSALLGRHSTVEALRSLAECSQLQLLNSVERLEEEGFLQIRDDAARVTHDLLSECTLNLVPPVTRRVLHSCVAANLEARYEATSDASILWDCAEQWTLSGETGKALEFLKRCAQHASQIGRAGQALALLERAKQLTKYPAELADVLGEMMITAKAAGDWVELYEFAKQRSAVVPADVIVSNDHSPLELLSIEARWSMQLESESVTQLFRCASDPDAAPHHRIDAALLLVRMAHELGKAELARTAYGIVEPLLQPNAASYAERILPIVYHASFGDREHAITLARKLACELDALPSLGDQFRAAHNVAIAMSILGELDESLAVLNRAIAEAEIAGMQAWHADLCSTGSSLLSNVDRHEEAEVWMARSARSAKPAMHALRVVPHFTSAFELALRRGDAELARKNLEAFAKTGVGDSLRSKASLRSGEIRLLQLDPQYTCDDETLKELVALYEGTKSLLSADSQVLALGEALRRRGMHEELRALLNEYFDRSRRERGPIPTAFAGLFGFLREKLGP